MTLSCSCPSSIVNSKWPRGGGGRTPAVLAGVGDAGDVVVPALMLRHDASGALVIEASYGLSDDVIRGARINFGEGIAGTVAQTGEPMLIVDVAADPGCGAASAPRAGISASMCVPLKDEDGAIHGVLSIRRHEPNPPFNEDDLKVFSVFATHAALAISNAQLYSRLNRKVQEMSAISEVLRAINSTLDLEHVLDQIVTGITEVVGFDRCCVYLLDTRSNEFVAGARKGYREADKVRDRASDLRRCDRAGGRGEDIHFLACLAGGPGGNRALSESFWWPRSWSVTRARAWWWSITARQAARYSRSTSSFFRHS